MKVLITTYMFDKSHKAHELYEVYIIICIYIYVYACIDTCVYMYMCMCIYVFETVNRQGCGQTHTAAPFSLRPVVQTITFRSIHLP